jgi:hypothetical protein
MSRDLDSASQLADAVRAVLAAARRMRRDPTWPHASPHPGKLFAAVETLDAALADAGPRVMPDTPWREVLAGDEVYSPKTDRWYPVLEVRARGALAGVTLDVDGRWRAYEKRPDETVTIRRPAGPEADAVAVLRAAGFDVATLVSAS